jgi:hypothetical protein
MAWFFILISIQETTAESLLLHLYPNQVSFHQNVICFKELCSEIEVGPENRAQTLKYAFMEKEKVEIF